MATTQKPTTQVRIGRLIAAIWPNDTNGATWYSVTFERLYRNADGQWRSSTSFRPNDLLLLAKLADRVHSRIHDLHVAGNSEDA